MINMNKEKMIIELSEEQTEKYFEIAKQKTTAEVNENCIPSGVSITIHISPPFGDYAEVNDQDIGDVIVKFTDDNGEIA